MRLRFRFQRNPNLWSPATALTASGEQVREWNLHLGGTAAFSPEGRRILTQTATGELSVWDLAKDRILVRIPAPNTETSNFVGFSMNGTQIIVGYASGQVFTWDAENGRPESRFLVFR